MSRDEPLVTIGMVRRWKPCDGGMRRLLDMLPHVTFAPVRNSTGLTVRGWLLARALRYAEDYTEPVGGEWAAVLHDIMWGLHHLDMHRWGRACAAAIERVAKPDTFYDSPRRVSAHLRKDYWNGREGYELWRDVYTGGIEADDPQYRSPFYLDLGCPLGHFPRPLQGTFICDGYGRPRSLSRGSQEGAQRASFTATTLLNGWMNSGFTEKDLRTFLADAWEAEG